MKLKTLKDMDLNSIIKNELISEDDIAEQIKFYLKNEAIKWIKRMEQCSKAGINHIDFYDNQFDDFCDEWSFDNIETISGADFENVINWIDWFFNIKRKRVTQRIKRVNVEDLK